MVRTWEPNYITPEVTEVINESGSRYLPSIPGSIQTSCSHHHHLICIEKEECRNGVNVCFSVFIFLGPVARNVFSTLWSGIPLSGCAWIVHGFPNGSLGSTGVC